MVYEYRLEEVDAQKTARIGEKKEAQKEKQEKAWNDDREKPKTPPPLQAR
jgi:hypothetical protein